MRSVVKRLNWAVLAALVVSVISASPAARAQEDTAASGYDAVRAALDQADYPTAITHLAGMAEAGDTLAATMLAQLMQSRLDGGGPNPAATREWLELAAENGSVHAALRLGQLYAMTPGAVGEDSGFGSGIEQAIYWFGVAAANDNPVAQAQLGGAYRLGFYSRVGEISREEESGLARLWLGAASEQGNPDAHLMLALSAHRDDPAERTRLIHAAARQGHPGALALVGARAIDPDGERFTPLSPVETYGWGLAVGRAISDYGLANASTFELLGVSDLAAYEAALAPLADRLGEGDRAAAAVLADEIAADWVSPLPFGPRPD